MNTPDFKIPEGARKLSPLEMNRLAILKAHTVITFTDTAPDSPQTNPQESTPDN